MKNSFGSIIYRFRLKKGISLRELARQVEVSPAFISLLENDKNVSSAKEDTVVKIANVLGLDREKLLHLARKIPSIELDKLSDEAMTFFRTKLKDD